ncbi:hypothetical protein D3C75_612170 [compost metagenome]
MASAADNMGRQLRAVQAGGVALDCFADGFGVRDRSQQIIYQIRSVIVHRMYVAEALQLTDALHVIIVQQVLHILGSDICPCCFQAGHIGSETGNGKQNTVGQGARLINHCLHAGHAQHVADFMRVSH